MNWEEAPHCLEPGSCCENCLGLGPGEGSLLLCMDVSASVTCLSPMDFCCFVLLIPGALSHGRLGFFIFGVSAGVGMVFGLECGWCVVSLTKS